jgi:hypothetical protein
MICRNGSITPHILNFGSRWVRLLSSRPIRLAFRERASGTIHWTVRGYQSKHCVMGAYDMQEWRYNSSLNFGSRWVRLLASRPIRLVFKKRASGTIHWTVRRYQKVSVRMVYSWSPKRGTTK